MRLPQTQSKGSASEKRFEHMKRHQKCVHTEGWSRDEASAGRHLQAKERGLMGKPTCWHLELGLLASRNRRANLCEAAPVCGLLLCEPQKANTLSRTDISGISGHQKAVARLRSPRSLSPWA